MNLLLTVTLALSATFTSASSIRSGGRQLAPAFPPYSQQCRDDAGPPFMDDSETFGNKKYHDDKPATAVGDCPDPLKGACASKPKLEAFLEGPVDCGGRGWFCRILEEPGWNPVALTSDVNFGYCNTTEGYEDEGWDKSGHCHGSDADETFYWWVRDHWHRGYNGRLRCCCGWEDQVKEGLIVNRCDHRRLVTKNEDLEKCRDANEEGSKPYNGGCSPNNSPTLNKPIPEDDAQCWEISKFGEPEDGDENDSQDNDSEDNDDEDEDEDENEDEDNDDEDEDEDNDSEDNDNESEDEDEDENEDESGSGSGSEDDEECSDDTSFAYRGKKKKTCSWVGKKQSRIDLICPKKYDGKLVSESCPATCGTCSTDDEDEDNNSEDNDSEDNDNESEDEDEDENENEDEDEDEDENEDESGSGSGSEDDEECSDDASFAYRGKKKKTCSWVGKKQSRIDLICPKKYDGKLVSESCPATCGTCSTDDEDEDNNSEDNDSEDNDNESEDEDEDENENEDESGSGSGSEDEDEEEEGSDEE